MKVATRVPTHTGAYLHIPLQYILMFNYHIKENSRDIPTNSDIFRILGHICSDLKLKIDNKTVDKSLNSLSRAKKTKRENYIMHGAFT